METQTPPPIGPRCRVCGDAIAPPGGWGCRHCFAPHHRDCWLYQGGCAIYGCGSEEGAPAASLPDLGQQVLSPAPARASLFESRRWTEGLARRLRSRGRDLPFTLREGLFGAAMTSLLYLAIEGISGPLSPPLTGFLALGVLHGLLAPWLAPWIHRHPSGLGVLTAAAFLVTFPTRLVSLPLVRTTLQILMVSVAATGVSEAALSDRSSPGEWLGARARPLRYTLTFFVATSLWLAAFALTQPAWTFTGKELRFFAFLGLLTTGVAAPTLERGHREFQAKLLADHAKA